MTKVTHNFLYPIQTSAKTDLSQLIKYLTSKSFYQVTFQRTLIFFFPQKLIVTMLLLFKKYLY